jgi:hypothetical protein
MILRRSLERFQKLKMKNQHADFDFVG